MLFTIIFLIFRMSATLKERIKIEAKPIIMLNFVWKEKN